MCFILFIIVPVKFHDVNFHVGNREKFEIWSNFKAKKYTFSDMLIVKLFHFESLCTNYVSVGNYLFFVAFDTNMHQNVEKTWREGVINADHCLVLFLSVCK